MKRLTRKFLTSDKVWFIDHDKHVDLEPREMSDEHIKSVIQKLAHYEELEEQGKLIIVDNIDVHPCHNCGHGWGQASSEGCVTCEESCEKFKQYNEKKIKL